jgi:hypothetical protein
MPRRTIPVEKIINLLGPTSRSRVDVPCSLLAKGTSGTIRTCSYSAATRVILSIVPKEMQDR